jgi:hypothetical protein
MCAMSLGIAQITKLIVHTNKKKYAEKAQYEKAQC